MRQLSTKHQFSTRSIPEVRYALTVALARLNRSGRLAFGGNNAVTQEAMINAAVLWMSDMEPADLERSLAPYVAKLEAMLADDDAPAVIAPEPDPAETFGGEAAPKPRRTRRA